jgi:hypothetical protein
MTHTAEPMTLSQLSEILRKYPIPGYVGTCNFWADSIDAELAKQGEAEPVVDEVVCEVLAFVAHNDDGPYLDFTGEGGLHDVPDGAQVWLLSGGDCRPEDGYMSLYTHPQRRNAAKVTDKASIEDRFQQFLSNRGLDRDCNVGEINLLRIAFRDAFLIASDEALSTVASRDREDAGHYTNAFKVFAEAFGAPLEACKFQNLRQYKFQHTNDLWIAWRKAFPCIDAARRENKP